MFAQLPDKNLAVSYYLKAANMGKDPEAMNCLGLIYEQGLGLDVEQFGTLSRKTSRDSSHDNPHRHIQRAYLMYE